MQKDEHEREHEHEHEQGHNRHEHKHELRDQLVLAERGSGLRTAAATQPLLTVAQPIHLRRVRSGPKLAGAAVRRDVAVVRLTAGVEAEECVEAAARRSVLRLEVAQMPLRPAPGSAQPAGGRGGDSARAPCRARGWSSPPRRAGAWG